MQGPSAPAENDCDIATWWQNLQYKHALVMKVYCNKAKDPGWLSTRDIKLENGATFSNFPCKGLQRCCQATLVWEHNSQIALWRKAAEVCCVLGSSKQWHNCIPKRLKTQQTISNQTLLFSVLSEIEVSKSGGLTLRWCMRSSQPHTHRTWIIHTHEHQGTRQPIFWTGDEQEPSTAA